MITHAGKYKSGQKESPSPLNNSIQRPPSQSIFDNSISIDSIKNPNTTKDSIAVNNNDYIVSDTRYSEEKKYPEDLNRAKKVEGAFNRPPSGEQYIKIN